MENKKITKKIFYFLFLILIVFTGCIFETSSRDDKTENSKKISENLCITFVPQISSLVENLSDISRSADFDASEILDLTKFKFTATLGTSSVHEGTVEDGIEKFNFEGLFSSASITAVLTVNLYDKNDSLSSPDVKPLLTGKKNVTIPAHSTDFSAGTIVLYYDAAICSLTKKGTAELSVKIPSGYELICDRPSLFTVTNSGESAVIKTVAGGIEPGDYYVIFTLKKGNAQAFAWPETINIFPGFKTIKWSTSSSTEMVRDVTSMMRYTLYVKGSNGEFYRQHDIIDSSIEPNGGIASPFTDIQAAVNQVILLNMETEDKIFNIFVDGKLSSTGTDSALVNILLPSKNLSLNITGMTGNETDMLCGNSSLTADMNNARVLFVYSDYDVNLTVKNISILSGGCLPDSVTDSGGGAFLHASADSVFVFDNVIFDKCRSRSGGAIFVSGSKCILKNGTKIGISDASLPSYATASNAATGNGGGISLESAVLELNDGCSVAHNFVSDDDGPVLGGGGIYCDMLSSLIIKDGAEVKNNSVSAHAGSEVYSSGIFALGDVSILGTVSENYSSHNAAQIVAASSDIKISGAAVAADVYLLSDEFKLKINSPLTSTEDYPVILRMPETNTKNYPSGTCVAEFSNGADNSKIFMRPLSSETDNDTPVSYKYYVDSDGKIKAAGVVFAPAVPGNYIFTPIVKNFHAGTTSGFITFEVTDPDGNEVAADSSSVSLLSGGNEIDVESSSGPAIAVLDISGKNYPLAEYQLKMTVTAGSMTVEKTVFIENSEMCSLVSAEELENYLVESAAAGVGLTKDNPVMLNLPPEITSANFRNVYEALNEHPEIYVSLDLSNTSITKFNNNVLYNRDTGKNVNNVVSVTLPQNLTSFGWSIFIDMTNLTECNGFKELLASGKPVSIAQYVLRGSNVQLGELYISSAVTLAAYSLYGSNITEVVCKTSASGQDTFANCKKLKKAEIDPPVPSSGYNGTFDGCTALESVIFGPNVKGMSASHYYVFGNCTKLKSLTLKSDTVVKVEDSRTIDGLSNSQLKIFVPASLVDSYKADEKWGAKASKIYPIVEDE